MYSWTDEFRSFKWQMYNTEEKPQINMQKRHFNEFRELAFFNTTRVTEIILTGLLLKNCDSKRNISKTVFNVIKIIYLYM